MSRLFDDASSEYLYSATSPLAALPVTMAFWFNADSLANFQTIISLGADASQECFRVLMFQTTGTISATVYNGTIQDHCSTTAGAAINTWYHGCVVYAADDDRASFLNGRNKGTDATNVVGVDVDNVSIGARYQGSDSEHFSGMVAEPAIWNITLPDVDVWQLAQGKPPWEIHRANLMGFWLPFGDRTDRDFSGRGYHMTPVNTPTFAADPPEVVRLWRA